MATNRPLRSDLKVTGMNQKDVYQWMANVTDAVNELMDDHATSRAAVASIKTNLNAVVAAAATTSASLAAIGAVGAVTESPPATLSDTTDITLLRS